MHFYCIEIVIGFQHKFDIRYGVISCCFRSCCHLKRGRFMLQMTYVYRSTPTTDSRMGNQIHCHLHPLIVTYRANHIFRKCNLRIDQRRCPNMNTGLIILLPLSDAVGKPKIFRSWINVQNSESSDWEKKISFAYRLNCWKMICYNDIFFC